MLEDAYAKRIVAVAEALNGISGEMKALPRLPPRRSVDVYRQVLQNLEALHRAVAVTR